MFGFDSKLSFYDNIWSKYQSENGLIVLRKIPMLIFIPVAVVIAYVYAFIFYLLDENPWIIYAKIIFATVGLVAYFFLLKSDNTHFFVKTFSIGLTLYILSVYFVPSEHDYTIGWTYIAAVAFIFPFGYKKGIIYSCYYLSTMLLVGLIDSTYTHYHFATQVIFSMYFCSLLVLVILSCIIDYVFEHIHANLIKISISDPLTSLFNRRKIDKLMSEHKQQHASLAILDIDNFKLINDNHGHLVGDEVLKKFADILRKSLRNSDFVGRWGGEEFIVLMPNTKVEDCIACMKNIQKIIEKSDFSPLEFVRCSIGISCTDNFLSFSELIPLADKALYRAKESGKNKTCVFCNNKSEIEVC